MYLHAVADIFDKFIPLFRYFWHRHFNSRRRFNSQRIRRQYQGLNYKDRVQSLTTKSDQIATCTEPNLHTVQ